VGRRFRGEPPLPACRPSVIGVSRLHGTPSPADRVLKQGTAVRKRSTQFVQLAGSQSRRSACFAEPSSTWYELQRTKP
jgi:hypothetical protein